MAITVDASSDRYVTVLLGGKLTAEDYEDFVPAIEALIEERGSLRLLLEMRDFHGWEMAAAWEDTKFGVRHFHDIDRIAMAGEKTWQQGMAVFCKPFTKASVRYFDVSEIEAARSWIGSD